MTTSYTWQKQKELLATATRLMQKIGMEEFNDFNIFTAKVDEVLETEKIKLSASEKNQIYNVVSWYDETAEKVIRKTEKLNGGKLENLLEHLNCSVEELPDYGYYPSGKKDYYITYESESNLRDSENIPLSDTIYAYFLREVKPHVSESWIDLDKTKIGYEISFNKYFYQHKPLRTIEEVTLELLELEKLSDGLIKEIVGE